MARTTIWGGITGYAKARSVFWLVAAAVMAGLVGSEYCLGAEDANRVPVQDIEATVQRIQTAFERARLVPAGKGTATVSGVPHTPLLGWGEEPAIVEFAFKGSMSRMDAFDVVASEKGRRRVSTAITDNGVYSVTAQKAHIQTFRPHSAFGRDFHPEVFLIHPSQPMRWWLEAMLDPKRARKVEVDDSGIVYMESEANLTIRGEPVIEVQRIVFNPNKSPLPMLCELEMRHPQRPEDSSATTVTLDWAEYDTGWYVRSGSYDVRNLHSGAITQHLELVITAFDPNDQISDEEFTLEGMGLRKDIAIEDRTTRADVRAPSPTITVDHARALLRHRLQTLQNLSAKYRVTAIMTPNYPPEHIYMQRGSGWMVIASGTKVMDKEVSILDGRASYDVRTVSFDRDPPPPPELKLPTEQRCWQTYSPERSERYFKSSNQVSATIEAPREVIEISEVELALGLGAQGMNTLLGPDGLRSMDVTVQDDGAVLLAKDYEEHGDRMEWLFSPEVGYGLTSHRWYSTRAENPYRHEHTMDDFRSVNGLMLPYRIESRQWRKGDLKEHRIVEVDEYEVGDPENTPERYFIRWPEGTYVIDDRTGVSIQITEEMAVHDETAGIPKPVSILGRPLGDLAALGVDLDADALKDKRVVLYFFDLEQRPSRNGLAQLDSMRGTLADRGVVVIAVHAAKIDRAELDRWLDDYDIQLPVGMIVERQADTRAAWGIESLPWLILTDRAGIVRHEGLSLSQLTEQTAGN